jgi:hypothetical protein
MILITYPNADIRTIRRERYSLRTLRFGVV